MPCGQVPISCGSSRRAAHHTLGDGTVSHTTTLRSRIQLPILSTAPSCKGWGCPTLQDSARSRDYKNLVPVSPTRMQADRLETRKGSTQRSPRLGEEKHTHSSQRWWHEEGTKHMNTWVSARGAEQALCTHIHALSGQSHACVHVQGPGEGCGSSMEGFAGDVPVTGSLFQRIMISSPRAGRV